MSTRIKVLPQYLLPKRALTAFAGKVANAKSRTRVTRLIRWFVGRYDVNMAEAQNPDVASYASFNDFFTRSLRIDARPLASADFVSPVDGAISQFGAIQDDQIFQAKGHHYSTSALLGGDEVLAQKFNDGCFATLYLSPKDYHRIHMPCDGVLTRMIYVPGALFSVNPTTARGVPGLFARNERVVCVFDSEHGSFALVLVGATIVGSMATVWHGVVNPPRENEIRTWDYPPVTAVGATVTASVTATRLRKGDEMGRFLLGSTVVMLFPKNTLTFNPAWQAEGVIRMGAAMGSCAGAAALAS